jgi:hypothetical protein
MEMSLAAALIAQGEKPDIFRLVEQHFNTMADEFRLEHGREFSSARFAERVYEWQTSKEPYISLEGFEVEAAGLSKHRLMIEQPIKIKRADGEDVQNRWFFRHERIMEFFLLPALLERKHRDRRFVHFEDDRFWGVYELMAERLPEKEESELYTSINQWAADKNQNELRNRYELARRRRFVQ